MNHRDRALAVLRYQPFDRLPLVHFGFWCPGTLAGWAEEGHVTKEEVRNWSDGNAVDAALTERLGFDLNWQNMFYPNTGLLPGFERRVVRELPDGTRHVLNGDGVVLVARDGAGAIPAEVEHTLKDRASWEEHYKWRYRFSPERVDRATVRAGAETVRFSEGGLELLKSGVRDWPLGLHCGSLYGHMRNVLGLTGSCYLLADDEPLFDEIVETVGDLCYRAVEYALRSGAGFDFAHFWEDICFKNGPIVSPDVFRAKVGPHYKRITDLVGRHGLDIVSLDCDGMIDALVPTWFENGVNTMFPIEVGTWNASIAPWRERFGRGLRGVGGMNKTVFARDRQAVDAEIERLKPLVALGGYIPCPDHRLAPDAKWDLVRYYTDRMRQTFG